jgi:hypothetical protein
MATSFGYQRPIEVGVFILTASEMGLDSDDEVWCMGTVLHGGHQLGDKDYAEEGA